MTQTRPTRTVVARKRVEWYWMHAHAGPLAAPRLEGIKHSTGQSSTCIFGVPFARRPLFHKLQTPSPSTHGSAEIWSYQHGLAGPAPQQVCSGTGSAKGRACSRILLSQLSGLC